MSAARAAQRLLISICNVAANPRPSCLLRWDRASTECRLVDVAAKEMLVSGAGICVDDRFVFHVSITLEGFDSLLSVLDRETLQPVSVTRLDAVRDAHSLVRFGDELFVASTGRDEVVAYEIGADGSVGRSRVVWSPTSSGTDAHHLNSLAVFEGEVVASAFGPMERGSWAQPKNGYISSVTSGTVLVSGLRQPHSLCPAGSDLLFCHSQEGTVNRPDSEIVYLAGYTRGLTTSPDGGLLAATSRGRKPSQPADDRPVFLNPTDPGQSTSGSASVFEFWPGSDRTPERALDLSWWADEIYDIIFT